jgi:hypothetical protein
VLRARAVVRKGRAESTQRKDRQPSAGDLWGAVPSHASWVLGKRVDELALSPTSTHARGTSAGCRPMPIIRVSSRAWPTVRGTATRPTVA